MTLLDFLQVVKRHLWLFFVVVALALVVSYFYTTSERSKYEAYASLHVTSVAGGTDQYGGFYSIQADSLAADNFVTWIKSPQVAGEIYQRAGVETKNVDLVKLGKKINIKSLSSQNIELRFISDNDNEARALINAATEIIDAQKKAVVAKKEAGQRVIELNAEPQVHSKPADLKFNLAVAAAASIILGLILIYLFHLFSGSLDYAAMVKRVLGRQFNYLTLSRLSLDFFVEDTGIGEKFTVLREKILAQNKGDKLVIVTADLGGGDSLAVASNLAKSFARQNRKVLLIEANFNHSSLKSALGLTKETGLIDYLADKHKLSEVVIESSQKNILLLPVGNLDKYQPEMSEKLAGSIKFNEVASLAPVVIMATANLPKSADALLLLGKTDNLVLGCVLGLTNVTQAKEVKVMLADHQVKPHVMIIG